MPDPPGPTASERELVHRLQAGDPLAATAVVDRLEPLVSRMVFRLTGWHTETEDLVNDVFLAIQKSAGTFRGDSTLETWATSITIHCCRRWQKLIIQRRHTMQPAEDEPIDQQHAAQQRSGELQEEVQLALQSLSQEMRELIVLRYLEDQSLEAISALLNVRKNTLEVRLHRGKKLLGQILAKRAAQQEEAK